MLKLYLFHRVITADERAHLSYQVITHNNCDDCAILTSII